MRLKAFAVEAAIVTLLFVALGFFYLRPASTELLRGNATVMVGDGTDSVTNPWQYRLVIDVAKTRPSALLYSAIYSDQMNAPEGAPSYIPWVERVLVLLYAPFLQPDAMPTAIVWALMVMSGLSFYAYGRVVGWPRAVAFALAIAWAFCPFTRARAVVHIGLVSTYWAPMLFIGLHVLARPPPWLSPRGTTILAATMFLGLFFAGQYFVVMAAMFSPAFLLYYLLLLPRSSSRVGGIGRLALAIIPAVLFGIWCLAEPLPPSAARALAPIVVTRSGGENAYVLKIGGARPTDYLLGDVKFGTRDLLPPRAALTAKTRAEVETNRHERANGIRWSILASCLALAVAFCMRRYRRRFSRTECILGGFAFGLALLAFLFSLSPQALRAFDTDLGPIRLVARVFPRFRVPNRIGVLVHFAALLGAGVFWARVLRKPLARRTPGAIALHAVLPVLMILDYAPLEPMPLAPIRPARFDLEGGGVCGTGMTVPYVTWGFRDEEYYEVLAELRGTSCKILHTSYQTSEDQTMRLMVGEPMFNQQDRWREVVLARCAGIQWVLFRLNVPDEDKRAFCSDLGFTFVAPDACRAPRQPSGKTPRVRPLQECLAETHIVVPKELLPLP